MTALTTAPPRRSRLPDPMPLEDGTWTTPRGGTVTVCRVKTPEGRIPTVQIRYVPHWWQPKDSCPHTIWLPDVARCYARAKRALERFRRDVDSLGQPILKRPSV